MLATRSTPDATVDLGGADTQALIAEARRRRRRRWTARLLVGAVLVGVAAAVAALTISGARSRSAGAAATAGVLPNGSLATLHAAGPLTVAPDGALYVTDTVGAGGEPGGNRVLVRLPDGRFRVIAGTGKTGFSGDGGPAVRAELSDVFGLAVAPDGTLYIADGGRVRTVTPNGVIHTIAGSGQPARTVTNGTPALAAPLGSTRSAPPLSIALSPAGQLYISTGAQILRLTAAGTLDPVRAIVTSAPGGNLLDRMARGRQLSAFDYIAVDAHGNIDVAGGPGGWAVWQVAPNGKARLASVDQGAHGLGGADPILQRGPGGAVYAAAGSPGIFRVEPRKLVPIAAFNGPLSRPPVGQAFLPLYFAFSPSGTLYADDESAPVFVAHQQLLSISTGHVSLLWQETNHAPK
jgi:glucose/arabinose dehydrogenase